MAGGHYSVYSGGFHNDILYVQKFSQYLIFMNFAVNAATMKIKSVLACQTIANIHPIEVL